MKVVGKLKAILGLDTKRFHSGLKKVQKRTQVFGKQMKKLGGVIAGALSLGAIVQGARKTITTFADFSYEMSRLKAISGATSEELKVLEEQAKKLGGTTQRTASQVAGLQVELSKKGFSPKQINEATEGIVKLSIASGEDLPQSAEIAAGVMNAFGMQAKDMGRIADVMAESFSASALDLNKFQLGMSKVAPVAKQVGMNIEQTSAMLGTLVDSNVKASTASAQLRNILITIKKEGISLSDAFARIRNAQDQVSAAAELFGKRASPIASILAANEKKTADLTKQFNKATGAADEMSNTMQDNLKGDLIAAGSALEALMIEAGQSENGGLRGIVKSLTEKIRSMTDNIDDTIERVKTWVKIIFRAVAGFTAMKLAIGAYLTVAKAAKIATQAWTAAQKALNFVMKANPIGLIISLVAALATAFITAWKRSEKFRNFFKKLWIRIKQYSKAAWDAVKTYFGSIGKILKAIGKAISHVFAGEFRKAKRAIVDGFGGVIDDFKSVGKEARKEAQKELAKLGEKDGVVTKKTQKNIEKNLKNKGKSGGVEFANGVREGVNDQLKKGGFEWEYVIGESGDLEKKFKQTRKSEGLEMGVMPDKTEGQQFDPFSTENVSPQLQNMDHILAKNKEMQESLRQTGNESRALSSVTQGLQQVFMNTFENTENALSNFFKFFTDWVVNMIARIASMIAAVTILAALLSLTGLGGVLGMGSNFGGVLKALTGGGLGKMIGGFVGMANGGVVPSGYPNDTYPALLSSGETVTPPNKLPVGKGGYIAETRISGDDLRILLREADRKHNNTL
jgi:hypothetical protein